MPLSDQEKIRLLPWTVAHSATNAVFAMYTVFGSLFPLFLDEMGMGKAKIGLLQSLLPFAGMVAPLVTPAICRWGLKRVFLILWATRKGVMALLIAAPWVLGRFGPTAAFFYVALILLGFAFCRAVAETAWYPWYQEVVPDSVRGRFSAVCAGATNLAMILAIFGSSYVISRYASLGLGRFQALMGLGVAFGAVCVWCAARVPGGGPIQSGGSDKAHWEGVRNALADRNFRMYLIGLGLFLLGSGPAAFVPLFLKEQVGLNAGQVVLIDAAALVGGLVSGYFWGSRADRAGSKPVMLGGVVLSAALAVCWLAAPRHSPFSQTVVLAIACAGGVAAMGWQIGSSRILYVGVVPPEQKTQYMSIYYAWMGVTGGAGPLLAGAALDGLKALAPQPLREHPYALVFAAGAGLICLGALALRNVRENPGPGMQQ